MKPLEIKATQLDEVIRKWHDIVSESYLQNIPQFFNMMLCAK